MKKNEIDPMCAGPRVWRDAAPILAGRVRLPKDAEFKVPKPGSRLVFQPAPRQSVVVGQYARLVAEDLTIWFRVERRLERPARYVVKVLGVSSEHDLEVAAYDAWDSGNGWVASASSGVAAPTALSLMN